MFWQLRPLGHPNTLSFGIMISLLQKFIIFFFYFAVPHGGGGSWTSMIVAWQ